MVNQDDFHHALSDFAEVARDLCDRLAGPKELALEELLAALDELLPLLYYNASRLVTVAPEHLFELKLSGQGEDTVEETGAEAPWDEEQEECARLEVDLRERLADTDFFVKVIDSGVIEGRHEYDTEERSFAADLAALYHNLVHDLALYHSAGERDVEACARTWVQGFEAIWGPNLPHMLAKVFHELYEVTTLEDVEEEAGRQ